MTWVGCIGGVGGIGLGLWWMDAAAATFIAASILWDGVKNTRAAITDLMDTRGTTFDDKRHHPDLDKEHDFLNALPWVQDVRPRTSYHGQFFHIAAFVLPRPGRAPSPNKHAAAPDGKSERHRVGTR